MTFILYMCVLSLLAWIYLALAHGFFWLPLLPETDPSLNHYPSVDIIVPARNEAEALVSSLPSLLAQKYPGPWRIFLIDDNSSDQTANVAMRIAAKLAQSARLTVITAPGLSPGWSGKVAAMHAGVEASQAPIILFTDADIIHTSDSLIHLVDHAEQKKIDLVSRMVLLHRGSFAEKLLIPAFVFFFAMLYPFRRANNPLSPVAAAAGGVMLLRRSTLDKIGGLPCIKSALIDDCSLAKAVKISGGKTELTLTRESESSRPYPYIRDVWAMVARSAYTQLHYSLLWLAATCVGMAVLYISPSLMFIAPTPLVVGFGLLVWLIMTVLYTPMIRFYGLQWAWALTLPVAALVYAAATVDSARLYYQGKGGQWKGRSQA